MAMKHESSRVLTPRAIETNQNRYLIYQSYDKNHALERFQQEDAREGEEVVSVKMIQ